MDLVDTHRVSWSLINIQEYLKNIFLIGAGALPSAEYYDSKSPQYFYNDPSLKWYPTTADKASLVPGVIKVGFYILARKYMVSRNRTYIQVGKIDTGGLFHYKLPGYNIEMTYSGDVDVLACITCTNGGTGPFCCT